MDMIFDTDTGQLSIDTASIRPHGADLRAMLDRHGQTVNLRGLKMRLTISADGAEIFDMSLPPPGVRYKQTDEDVLATGRVKWQPDQQIKVQAWCKTTQGHELTAEADLTAPRPAKPYDSWEWSGTHWEAPVPYPDDGGEYQWDEGAGEWVETDNI